MNVKICFVTREYAHEQFGKSGGIGVFLKNHCNSLSKFNFDVHVFSFGMKQKKFNDGQVNVLIIKDLSKINEKFKEGYKSLDLPGYISLKIFLEFVNRIYRSLYLTIYLYRNKIDLIEFHDYGGDIPFLIGSYPSIIRCHGSAWSLHRHMGYIRRKTDDIFEKVLFRRFKDHVIAVSNFCADITSESFNLEKRPAVIYNGVKIPFPIGTDYEYLDKDTVSMSVFYIGSIRERKGINIACAVFNKIVERIPGSTFHVFGHNNNDHWNQVANPILSDIAREQTTYHGFVPNEQMSNHIRKGHVFLFPSFGENFSVALLEVMAMGKIVVTSDIPSFREIIDHGKNGYIAGSEKDYVDIIIDLFNDKHDLNSVGYSAYRTIQDRFEQDLIIQQNVEHYNSIIGE